MSKTSIPFRNDAITVADENYTCDECSESFPDIDAFIDHMIRLERQKKLFVCSVCWKSFSHEYYLQKHTITHYEGPKHRCDQCSKTLSSRKSLRRHMSLVHGSGGKTYKCDVCLKYFALAHHLKEHLMTHIGVNHQSVLSLQPSANSNNLKNLEMVHDNNNNNNKFKCLVCFNAFSHRRTLNLHVMKYHLLLNRNDVSNESYLLRDDGSDKQNEDL